MEQAKGTKSSSSSFPLSELSGSKVPPSSSTKSRLLDSLFPSETKSVEAQMKDTLNEILDRKSKNSGNGKAVAVFQDNCIPPCSLSSSIYYGGQDDYPLPKPKQCPVYNDDGVDSGYAIRGNWWQGSFYY